MLVFMSFVYVWWLETDYQPTPESENDNQEGHVSAIAHRTLIVTIYAKQKNKKMCTGLCESFEGGGQAAAHSLLHHSPASL